MLAVRSSEVAARRRASARTGRRSCCSPCRRAIAGFGGAFLGMYTLHRQQRRVRRRAPASFWLALAVTFGIRRPGGALLAGLAFGVRRQRSSTGSASDIPARRRRATTSSRRPTSCRSSPASGPSSSRRNPTACSRSSAAEACEKRREKERARRIAAAEADVHGGVVPRRTRRRTRPTAPARRDGGAPQLACRRTSAALRDRRHRRRLRRRRGAARRRRSRSHRGKIVALLGANGAGKSTLCSVAARPGRARSGQVARSTASDITESRVVRARRATACCSCPRPAGSSPASPSRRT